MTVDFNSAVNRLKQADNILILTHMNPDGDTLGSGYALLRALKAMGKRARLLNGDKINSKFGYIYDGIESENFKPDFIVSVDVAEKKLLGDELMSRYGDKVDLAIDHHDSSRLFAKETYCESDSASCCEIIYLIIKALGVKIDSAMASCIYTGCSTDTGCFKYSGVTPRTHRIAAELIELGAAHSKINEIMFDTKTVGSIALERMCLESLEYFGSGKIAAICVTKAMLNECNVDKSALDAIKPLTRQIEGVEIGITVKEEDNGKVGISLRTSENYDAAAICAHFGGGGHIRAAGCEMKNVTVGQAKEMVAEYILDDVL